MECVDCNGCKIWVFDIDRYNAYSKYVNVEKEVCGVCGNTDLINGKVCEACDMKVGKFWSCRCGEHNLDIYTECRSCNRERKQWTCKMCDLANDIKQGYCKSCLFERPFVYTKEPGWTCALCSNFNGEADGTVAACRECSAWKCVTCGM